MTTATMDPKQPVDTAEILRLRAEGVSLRKVASQVGCSKAYVAQVEAQAQAQVGASAPAAAGLPLVDLATIRGNPWQTRPINETFVEEMEVSIEQLGLLEPMLGRPMDDGTVQQATGHHRVAAIRRLVARGAWAGGVPMLVRPMSDEETALVALEENDKRKSLDPFQEILAYRKALDEIEGLTVQALADRLGKDRSTVSNDLRLLRLPKRVLNKVASGEVPTRAAREFLCLVADEHAHEDIMASIIQEIAQARHGAMPDWRAGNVRRLLNARIHGSRVAEWRRLEKRGFFGGSHSGPPVFDVAKFAAECGGNVHHIPGSSAKGEGSESWTCATAQWKKWQDAAAAQTNGGTKDKPPAKDLRHLVNDPVGRQVLAPAISQETQAAVKPPTKLDQEAADKLGTRAKVVKVGYEARGHRLSGSGFHHGDEPPPPYFPDLNECRKTCTWGATYVTAQYNSGDPELRCMNEEHWQEKLQLGMEVYKRQLQERIDVEDSEDDQMAVGFLAKLPEALALPVAAALLASNRFPKNAPVEGENRLREFAYTPLTLRMVNRVLGLEDPKEDQYHPVALEAQAALTALEAAKPDIAAVVASRLLAWTIRESKVLEVQTLLGGPVEVR